MWNFSVIVSEVSEEKAFDNVDVRTTDGRWSDWYTISSPMRLRLRWAKIQCKKRNNFLGLPKSNPKEIVYVGVIIWACYKLDLVTQSVVELL